MTNTTFRTAATGSALFLAAGLTALRLSPAAAHVSVSSTPAEGKGHTHGADAVLLRTRRRG